MRIIAGKYKGRRLFTPTDDAIRPTSDRAREAIFNLLMHGKYAGENVIEAHVVDLCCGTGALGLEALSRGSRKATFIDRSKQSLELAKQNVTHCGANGQSHFLLADAAKLPPTSDPANLVIIDAPYASPMLLPAYDSLRVGGWLAPGSLIVAEQSHSNEAPILAGASLLDRKTYGKSGILIYRI